MRSSPWVFETAIRAVDEAGFTALFLAAAMRARMPESASAGLGVCSFAEGILTDRLRLAKLARAARALNARADFAGSLPPLALMTDDLRLPDPLSAARALPRGSLVILRARDVTRRAQLAANLRIIAHEHDLRLLIAADPELAMRMQADGLHLPEARANEAHYWRARHPGWLITCAAHSLRAVQFARRVRADAAFLSPVFSTQSHEGTAPLGALRFRILAREAMLPIYALGGIDEKTARQLAGARCAGLAAVGALAI